MVVDLIGGSVLCNGREGGRGSRAAMFSSGSGGGVPFLTKVKMDLMSVWVLNINII